MAALELTIGFHTHIFQHLFDALQHTVGRPLGAADLRADFGRGVPLQAEGKDFPMTPFQIVHQLFHGLVSMAASEGVGSSELLPLSPLDSSSETGAGSSRWMSRLAE